MQERTDQRVFVFVYDQKRIQTGSWPLDVARILSDTGFHCQTDVPLQMRLETFIEHGVFDNPVSIFLAGGEGFFECIGLTGFAQPMVELQLGSVLYAEAGMFGEHRYTPESRDRLVACVERLVALAGFEFGFAHSPGKYDERDYRDWFNECIIDGRFMMHRLVHEFLHLVAVGGEGLKRCPRWVFEQCPAWRISSPSPESICVFLDNLVPAWRGMGSGEDVVMCEKEAFQHLRENLGESC